MKRLLILSAILLGALGVNAIVVDRDSRPAASFADGRVIAPAESPVDLNIREYAPETGSGRARAVKPAASDAQAVVLLHGYSASIEWWAPVAEELAERLQRRVIAVDLVGHGGSAAPADAERYTPADQAAAIHLALEQLGVRRAIVIGHSMGGSVATVLAESDPDLVEQVVVSDTVAGPGLVGLPVLGRAVCWPLVGPAFDRLRRFDAVDTPALQVGFAADYPVPEFAYRSLQRLTHHGVCDSRQIHGINDEKPVAERLAELNRLGVPVAVIWGERDVLTPTDANVERYRAAGLDATIIAGAGHSPMVEKPADFLTAVTGFVSRSLQ